MRMQIKIYELNKLAVGMIPQRGPYAGIPGNISFMHNNNTQISKFKLFHSMIPIYKPLYARNITTPQKYNFEPFKLQYRKLNTNLKPLCKKLQYCELDIYSKPLHEKKDNESGNKFCGMMIICFVLAIIFSTFSSPEIGGVFFILFLIFLFACIG